MTQTSASGNADPTPEDAGAPTEPVYFAFNQAEAEYIISYLDSADVEAETEPDEEHPGMFWVLVPAADVCRALQAIAHEREGKLDEKGVEAIRTAMGFSGGQMTAITVWSLLLLVIVLLAALFLRH